MLLNPNIIPGTILKLEDDRLGGWYKVTEIRHYGSFRENDWYTDVYCDIKNTQLIIPLSSKNSRQITPSSSHTEI